MSANIFTYVNDVPTVESALAQGMGRASACWDNLAGAGVFQSEEALKTVEMTLAEIRQILTGELSTLLDRANVATEWNDAIEQAIRCVEGGL